MTTAVLVLTVLSLVSATAPNPTTSSVPTVVDARTLQTFSIARKGISLCPCEKCVDGVCSNCTNGFSGHNCADIPGNFETELMNVAAPSEATTSTHVMRLFWVTGDLVWPAFGNCTMRVYVDGDTEPSLQFMLYEAHALAYVCRWQRAVSSSLPALGRSEPPLVWRTR